MARPPSADIRDRLPRPAGVIGEPRARGSRAAQIADEIREAIMDGRLALGEALSEVRLAEAFDVSRAPIRDALTKLQIEGVIDVRPQAGSFVFTPTDDDVVAMVEFRALLETTALRLCFARQRDAALRGMRAAADDMERARNADDRLAVARADTAFHWAMVGHCGNDYLADSYRLISGRVGALRTHNLLAADTVRKGSLAEHRSLIAAVARGNLARAETILTEHIGRMRQRYQLVRGSGGR
ncbi:MAG: GntR family transcriptional regulator [Burkholderiales bacterium]|nr:GntR family transcriptional regulator [Burkholderiales bacterium]